MVTMALFLLGNMVVSGASFGQTRLLASVPDLPPMQNAYQIDKVDVDVTASTAAIARELAIRRGQRRALNILLRRLTIAEDRRRIPTLDDASVAALVLSIQFHNERYSSIRYIAKLTITFNKEGVRHLLDISGSAFSETMARPILVLPHHDNAGLSVNWDDNSTWLEAWQTADWRTSLVPFIVPDDEDDLNGTYLNDEPLLDNAEEAARLAKLYGTSETLVVEANDSIDIFTGASQLAVKTVRRGIGDEIRRDYLFTPRENETPEELFARVAAVIGGEIAQDWKVLTLVSLDQIGQIQARFYLTDLAEWVQLKKRLTRIPVIRDVNLTEISVSKVAVTLNYLGTEAQLSATLKQYGIAMEKFEQHWVLLFQ